MEELKEVLNLLKESAILRKGIQIFVEHWKIMILIIIVGAIVAILSDKEDNFIPISKIKGIVKK